MFPAFTPFTALAALTGIIYAALGVVVVLSVGYLLTLLLSAARVRKTPLPALADETASRFLIVIPAHDEELVIGATLGGLNALDYPRDRFSIVVIADNCEDTTAEIARNAGATVMERHNLEQRGKGFALEWAFSQLLSESQSASADAYVIVDADTLVAPDFLRRIARRLWANVAPEQRKSHRAALQGRYGVLNTSDSWRSALMTAAFDLFNHVKPLGRDRLGLSVGLKGNGMAFTHALLNAAPWQGSSITEDIDYGLDLLQKHEIAVGYAPEAIVVAQMPTTAKQSASQRERWERGRYKLMRERAFPLLWDGLRRGNLRRIDAAFDLLLPPLAELFTLCVVFLAIAAGGVYFGLLPLWAIAPPVLAFAGYIMYVLGGLKVAGAKREAYAALLRAPSYALWKFALLLSPGKRRARKTGGQDEWVRTERAALSAPTPPASNASSSEGTIL